MDLKQRLAQFERLSQRPEATEGRTTSDHGAVAGREGAETAPPVDAATSPQERLERLGLVPRDTPAGPAFHRDAPATVTTMPELGVDLDGILREPGAVRHPAEILFLDTETTGLAGGTGSLPFLVGLAWWEEGGFHVRQYFLPGPGREAPILHELERLATRFRAVATYNGATFDLPLLRTRALLARRKDPLAGLASWDLLTAARRLWGRRLPDVRQPTVEGAVCGRPRAGHDIPGALIPQTYFRYLETGDTGDIARVLLHNHWDMEGMAEILTAVATVASELDPLADEGPAGRRSWPERVPLNQRPADRSPRDRNTVDQNAVERNPVDRYSPDPPPWQDAWARGRIWEYRRDVPRAAAWLARAVAGSGLLLPVPPESSAAPPERFLADAVRILKRVRRWDLLRALVERGLTIHGEKPWLRREAAILYEHRLGRLDRALVHAEALGEEKRLRRLRRKIATVDGCPGRRTTL